MDSPSFSQGGDTPKVRKPAGPWDGKPGADPYLGAYYRNAAAEKRKKANAETESWVDEANLANYYKQAEAQKRKQALERMKREDYGDTESTGSSEVSDGWVDPNVATYYRHAEAEKKKQQQQTPKKQAPPVPSFTVKKGPRVYAVNPSDAVIKTSPTFSRLRHVGNGLNFHPVPPPAPTPPPRADTTDTEALGDSPTGKKAGPPEGAAESWFKTSMAGESPTDYWNASQATIESPADEKDGVDDELRAGLPPAPTPPLSRGDTPASSGGYYASGW